MNKAYWLENYGERRNTTAFFSLRLTDTSADYTLKIASSVVFRVLVNGKLIGYVPRRTYGDFAAVNTYRLPSSASDGTDVFVTVEYVHRGRSPARLSSPHGKK